MDNSEKLGTYKGLPIIDTKIIINKLGDGLSKAVGVEPMVADVGDDHFISCRVRKTKDRYDVNRDDDGNPVSYTLVQIFDATGAMFTDAKLAKAGIAKMVEKIRKAEVDAKGQLDLELDAGEDELAAARRARGADAQ